MIRRAVPPRPRPPTRRPPPPTSAPATASNGSAAAQPAEAAPPPLPPGAVYLRCMVSHDNAVEALPPVRPVVYAYYPALPDLCRLWGHVPLAVWRRGFRLLWRLLRLLSRRILSGWLPRR